MTRERTLDEAMGLTPAEITELREKAERLAGLEQDVPDECWPGMDR